MGFCKKCGKNFGHYCYNCGYDRDLHPNANGYCSWKCLREDNGPEYYEDLEDEEEYVEEKEISLEKVSTNKVNRISKTRLFKEALSLWGESSNRHDD